VCEPFPEPFVGNADRVPHSASNPPLCGPSNGVRVERVRVVLAGLPRMLAEIVRRVLGEAPDLEVIDMSVNSDNLADSLEYHEADVLVTGLRPTRASTSSRPCFGRIRRSGSSRSKGTAAARCSTSCSPTPCLWVTCHPRASSMRSGPPFAFAMADARPARRPDPRRVPGGRDSQPRAAAAGRFQPPDATLRTDVPTSALPVLCAYLVDLRGKPPAPVQRADSAATERGHERGPVTAARRLPLPHQRVECHAPGPGVEPLMEEHCCCTRSPPR
jgi:hypothetical protein